MIVYRFFKDATIGSLDCLQCSRHFDAFHAVHPLEVCAVGVSVMVLDRLWCVSLNIMTVICETLPNIVMYVCRSLNLCWSVVYRNAILNVLSPLQKSIFVKLLSCDMVNCYLCRLRSRHDLFASAKNLPRATHCCIFFCLGQFRRHDLMVPCVRRA